MITRIHVTNFRSFENCEIELGNLNLIIGANSAGKSNFLQIFRFIRDIASEGLKNAVYLQGGPNYLPNLLLKDQDCSFEIVIEYPTTMVVSSKNKVFGVRLPKLTYEFSFGFELDTKAIVVTSDVATFQCDFYELELKRDTFREKGLVGKGTLILRNVGGAIEYELEADTNLRIKADDFRRPTLADDEVIPKGSLMLNSRHFYPFLELNAELLTKISFHDFQPKLAKTGVPFAGRDDLDENGANLPVILKSILENEEARDQLLLLVKDLFPFAEDLDIREYASESYMIWMKESKIQEHIPATLMSEGTIRVAALMVLLYFRQQPIVLVEEPERNIHPYLISKVVNMLIESSNDIQIIATTHNPLVVKYIEPQNIILVRRNETGFSEVIRPSEVDKIREFLMHDMGIDELFVSNLLGG